MNSGDRQPCLLIQWDTNSLSVMASRIFADHSHQFDAMSAAVGARRSPPTRPQPIPADTKNVGGLEIAVPDPGVPHEQLACSGVEAFISLSGSKRCVFMSRVFDEQEDARASPAQEG